MSSTDYEIRRQTEAAKSLLADLRVQGADDDVELVADAIEGETDLHEALAAALDEIDDEEVHIEGLKAKEKQFAERRSIKERRVERIRAAIERAMVAVDLTTLKLPTATLSIARRKPGAVIDDEALIPSRFFKLPDPPAPKVDKKAVAEALANEEAVPGAHLDNGSISLTVRRK